MAPIYKIDHVTKTYQTREVLSIDHLEIDHGEFLAIIGPSGAGKSTFLRLLNFLESPTSGIVAFNDHAYHHVNEGDEIPLHVRRQITMVFQRPYLLNRSVFENITYGLKLRRRSIDHKFISAPDEIKALVERLGLSNLVDQPVRTLSGGEMQRVALARALVIEPQVLLLDEATANLDPYNVKLIEEIVLENNEKHDMTVVMVTHNIFQARRLAHRTAFLLDGKLVEVNETEAIFTRPNDPRTAAFIHGEMIY